MTSDSQRFLSPEVIARIRTLELRARTMVEGLLVGRHRSPLFGHSVEFAQHREYVAGDDLRHIDWKVWAKSDRYYIKQFEEETNLHAVLVVDASGSMAYGEGETNKFEYACGLAASLGYLLLQQSDAVGLTLFDEVVRDVIEPRTSPRHLRNLLAALDRVGTGQKTDLEAVLIQLAERLPRRGLVFLLSDLLGDREALLRGWRQLRRRRHDVVVFHLMHDDELDFPFEGTTRFEAMEGPERLTCDPRSLRANYLKALEHFLNDLRQMSNRTGVDYRLIRTSQPMGAVLAALLHERIRA